MMGIPYLSVVLEINAGIKFCNVLRFLRILALLIVYLPVSFRWICKIAKSNSLLHRVCLSARNNLAPTGWIVTKLDIWVFFKICQENLGFIKTGRE